MDKKDEFFLKGLCFVSFVMVIIIQYAIPQQVILRLCLGLVLVVNLACTLERLYKRGKSEVNGDE